MATNITQRRAPGSVQPFVTLNPSPVIANVAPTTFDNYDPSTIWIQPYDLAGNPVNSIWILASVQNGSANWVEIAPAGGAGIFDFIQLPNTDVGGTIGYISFGGNRFITDLGVNNTFVGTNSGSIDASTEFAEDNTAVGFNALNSLLDGVRNTMVGSRAGQNMAFGADHVGVGFNALSSAIDNTTSGAVAIGNQALSTLSTATGCTAVGYQAGSVLDSSGCTCIGYLSQSQLNGTNNTSVGYYSMGFQSGTASSSVAIGALSLFNITTGNNNCAIGYGAGQSITTSQENVLIGRLSGVGVGNSNVAVGNGSLINATGNANVAIGTTAGSNVEGGSNNIMILNSGTAGDDNVIRIGSSAQQTCFVGGIATATIAGGQAVLIDIATGKLGLAVSSQRYKENIQPLSDEMAHKIFEMEPVTFDYKESNESSFGLIAEEMHEILPAMVNYNQDGLPNGIKYELLSVLLLKEIKKMRQEIELLKNS